MDYSRRSDCFRNAAIAIQVRCTDLEMDETERVHAAISMTLCELRTAKHLSPPLECTVASLSDDLGGCVEALSRSAQFWSSYSGYLREVPQLCASYLRLNDIDAARTIYHNISLEKTLLLQQMLQRERDAQSVTDMLGNHLMNMATMSSSFEQSMAVLHNLMDGISVQHSADRDMAMASTQDMIAETRAMNGIVLAQLSSGLDASLADIINRHTSSMEHALAEFSVLLSTNTESLFAGFSDRYLRTLDSMQQDAHDRWSLVGTGVNELRATVNHLVETTGRTITTLEASNTQGLLLADTQAAATDAANDLAITLSQLTQDARHNFDQINASIALMQDSFVARASWLRTGITEFLGLVLRVDPHSLHSMDHVFRMVSLCWDVWAYFVQSVGSLIMSTVLVLYSYRTASFCRRRKARPLRHAHLENIDEESKLIFVHPTPSSVPAPQPQSISSRRRRVSRIPDRLVNASYF
ncbi:hypothetical protein CYLTODRAFT_441713 [Cylindrobasidium torrendii FP15055 ss-10]|uniref:Nuclear fusion protein KAR5 n=1 Tax=Cylindrobasidium torrendii FP15055 ss-10 TaxID=1314674 RepID=A0A0D7BK06_9AGAR|nr:hypothetical protein CYLTODRAFT_441713 [Cylindrobasidium torrendii FP15055 ss-10]